MVRTLRPGGWLVIEEIDVDFQPSATPDASNAQQYLSNRIRAGLLAVLGQHGVDLELGRKVPRLLREVGLVDVAADGYFPLASPAAAALEVASIEHARDALVALRAASDDELDTHLGAARAGSVDVSAPPLISVWGRRPAPDDDPRRLRRQRGTERQVAHEPEQHHEHGARPEVAAGRGRRARRAGPRPPTHRTHSHVSNGTLATSSTLRPAAPSTSPRVNACSARRDPHPGHHSPVTARNGHVG